MMMFKFVVLCALIAAPVLGSTIGRRDETKGGRIQVAPVEQQRQIEQSALKSAPKQESFQSEQREEVQQQQQQQLANEPEYVQQKEEAPKVEELAKGQRYEAKPQVSREELASPKGQTKAEERFEQRQQQRNEWESQQVELREEQRPLAEEAPLQQQPLAAVEEQHLLVQEQQQFGSEKGASLGAPAGMAEPYAFSYQVEGSSRSESSDANGVVRGQYTIQGADGPSRVVDYVADQNGFRASVNTNEFGTESKSAANVALRTSQPNAEDITLRLEGKTREDLGAAVKGAPAPFAQRVETSYASKTPVQPLPLPAPAPLPLPLPVQAPIPFPQESRATKRAGPETRAPAKGLRAVAPQQQQQQQQQQQEEERDQLQQEELAAPVKSAQLSRAPVKAQQRVFESATAHRVYRQPVQVVGVRPAPAVAVRREPTVSSVVRGPVPAAHRPQVRYPPSPVLGYRRQQVALEPVVRRRLSYSPVAPEDEQPSFD